MKIAILTSLCGSREHLSNPVVIHNNVDYYAFVDENNIQPNVVWKQQVAFDFTTDERFKFRRNAKIYKVLPFLFAPGYDFYFWVDVSHDVVEDPFKICETYMRDNMFGFFRHTSRNCIYKEANELLRLNYDHCDNITRQVEFYKSQKYPENNGLFELSTFITKNCKEVNETCLTWWEQICRYASRDQISLPFSLWKHNVSDKVSVLPGFANGYNSFGTIGNNPLMPQTRIHHGGG